jgi:hypothetical protein
MHNQMCSKGNSVKGQGSSMNLNLTTGPPKKKAALQAYMKYYWESNIKQAVINQWVLTPETDLFREIDNGEDQVAWEAMTLMEKSIPLWFQMEIGSKVFEAESEEVKADINRHHKKEKREAIKALMVTFNTDKERLRVMKCFDG